MGHRRELETIAISETVCLEMRATMWMVEEIPSSRRADAGPDSTAIIPVGYFSLVKTDCWSLKDQDLRASSVSLYWFYFFRRRHQRGQVWPDPRAL
jgi:hypothetical protein